VPAGSRASTAPLGLTIEARASPQDEAHDDRQLALVVLIRRQWHVRSTPDGSTIVGVLGRAGGVDSASRMVAGRTGTLAQRLAQHLLRSIATAWHQILDQLRRRLRQLIEHLLGLLAAQEIGQERADGFDKCVESAVVASTIAGAGGGIALLGADPQPA
jgi:hypothetical protein